MTEIVAVLVSQTFRVAVGGLLVLLVVASVYLFWLSSPGPGGRPWWQDPGRRWVAWFYMVAMVLLAGLNFVLSILVAAS